MFALYLLIVFTTENHHLNIFLRNYFTSQQLEWWLYVMKTSILYLSEIVSKNSEQNIVFIYLCSTSGMWNFEMSERKFVGESSILVSIQTKIRSWKVYKGLSDTKRCWNTSHPPEDRFPENTVVIIQNRRPAIYFHVFLFQSKRKTNFSFTPSAFITENNINIEIGKQKSEEK